MDIRATDEQQHCLDLFGEGIGLAINAGAGSGKTATLKLMAESAPTRRGQYLAFNRAIVEEAQRKMPTTVAASTIHSLAMRAKGREFRHRLDAPRMHSDQLARLLGMDPLVVTYENKPKVLQPSYLASLVMRSLVVFCQTADKGPSRRHVPYVDGIDELDGEGGRMFTNNAAVRDHVALALDVAWRDLCDPRGRLPFTHGVYLKLWELDSPKIAADYLLLDEAQDTAPVMESIVLQQTDAQIVVVGDANQSIYSFTGAVDALSRFMATGAAHASLTQSFRFGQPIADVANCVLDKLDTDLRMTGFDQVDSEVRQLVDADVDAYLCRSNAGAVRRVLELQKLGQPVHLFGGAGDVLSFVRGARKLMDGGTTTHLDLACFTSWNEVVAYVEFDPSGDDLRLLVGLIEQFGADQIETALSGQHAEEGATVVSTAHKAKGREWPRVRLNDDFKQSDAPEELRLGYVACTRAQNVLDLVGCPLLTEIVEGATRCQTGAGTTPSASSRDGAVSDLDRQQDEGRLRPNGGSGAGPT